ncbi:unnamed protein product [Owenia fusiformis]|uniref:Uncharacterized protein n=1 Tax=Owenia fusiformis TaxID=6347 RepID=A0A8S4N1S2_OWEFU|nr:unnamed protein product [Owenia fusiformis]
MYKYILESSCQNCHFKTDPSTDKGHYESPGFPNNYAKGGVCSWKISAPSGAGQDNKRIKITINKLDIKKGDEVIIWDGPSCDDDDILPSISLKEYSKSIPGTDIVFSMEFDVCVELKRPSSSDRAAGISFDWETIPGCGGTVSKTTDILTPRYPTFPYVPELEPCDWSFKMGTGQKMLFEFQEFKLRGPSLFIDCDIDWMILKGIDGFQNNQKLCGERKNLGPYKSTGNTAEMIFRSQLDLIDLIPKKGFWIRVTSLGCSSDDFYIPHSIHTNPGTFYDTGYVAKVRCKEGYQFNDDYDETTLECQADQKWKGTIRVCMPKQCGDVPNVSNGKVKATSGNDVGSVATYTCDIGYNLVGEATRTCQPDQTWSGTTPQCQGGGKTACGNPGAPANGAIIGNNFNFGQTVKFVCNIGYELAGQDSLTCQQDGTWNGDRPTCTLVQCDIQEVSTPPLNGNVRVDGSKFGDVAIYTCNPGYILVGDNRICDSDGTWTGSTPQCISEIIGTECPIPTTRAYSSVTYNGLVIGSIATYTCFYGYTLDGLEQRTCLPSGEWSGLAPFCSRNETATRPPPRTGGQTDVQKAKTVGIVVGVVIPVVVLVSLTAGFLIYKRRNSIPPNQHGVENPTYDSQPKT